MQRRETDYVIQDVEYNEQTEQTLKTGYSGCKRLFQGKQGGNS